MLPLGMRAKGPGKMTIHSALSARLKNTGGWRHWSDISLEDETYGQC